MNRGDVAFGVNYQQTGAHSNEKNAGVLLVRRSVIGVDWLEMNMR
jgi:hypothetical protein